MSNQYENNGLARRNQKNEINTPVVSNAFPTEQPQTQEPKPQEQPQKQLTLEDYEKKEIAVRSVALSKDSWAFLKVMSKLEHKSQQDYLDLIIQEKQKSLNLGDDIKAKIKDQRKTF